MARQIKFRIWDRQENRFVDNDCGTHCCSNWHIDAFSGGAVDFVSAFSEGSDETFCSKQEQNYWMDGTKVVKEPRYVVQQFTTLFDKKGLEIYEGDIVKTWTLQKERMVRTGVVAWFSNGFAVQRDSQYWLTSFITTKPNDIEIIGNIFENPELLKQ